MAIKTLLEILENQYNEQLNIVVSRDIQMEVLKKLDPERVVEIRMDHNLEARKITAKDMLRNAEEKQALDTMWLKVLDEKVKEETLNQKAKGESPTKKSGVE